VCPFRYPGLKQLDKEMAWFRAMMNVVGRRLLGDVSWGLKARVIIGAGMSIVDMATDIVVVVAYLGEEKKTFYGFALLYMILVSMVLQLIVVFLQHQKKPMEMVKWTLIVLTGLAPGFHAQRVASGKEMEEHHLIDAKTELVVSKMLEMVAESVPGCVLQTYVMVKVGGGGKRAITSLAVSALATGFSSASISFDQDVDPSKRRETPDFYGYVPDGGSRTVLFACMLLNSALMLLMRSFGATMLIILGRGWFWIYMMGDMAIYLLQLLARGDFHFFPPFDGWFGLSLSLLMRVIIKILCDFTGLILLRSPTNLGGCYWTLNMFGGVLGGFLSVWLYLERGEGEVEERVAWGTIVLLLGGAWAMVFGVFMWLVKKGYKKTFFSTQTGKAQVIDRFMEGEGDAVKSSIMKRNKKMWWAIRGEVKDWVVGGWWRWQEEKPEWFTLAWQRKVPQDFLDWDEEIMESMSSLSSVGTGRMRDALLEAVKQGAGGRGGAKVAAVALPHTRRWSPRLTQNIHTEHTHKKAVSIKRGGGEEVAAA